jgi:two-component system, LuxR family, sensor histidine kinase DctS
MTDLVPPIVSAQPHWLARWRPTRRLALWSALVVLVAGLLVILIWLAGRYEASQVQSRLERDATDAVSDVRAALTRNIQNLQALPTQTNRLELWALEASVLLREHRAIVRVEWRDNQLNTLEGVDSPYQKSLFARMSRNGSQNEVQTACTLAKRLSGPGYAPSYFLPQLDGLGMELIEMCMPLSVGGQSNGYVVATYSLQNMLMELISKPLTRGQEVSFTEADGTRLAIYGVTRRGSRVFSAQQLLDLPGNTLVLRIDSWRSAPDLFPNVLTAMVTLMSIALILVLILLGKDIRKRLQAEQGLAEALAFRKAMEDSLVTGMRARDLQGRITYVNPALCQMTGFTATELVGISSPMPYWPPELADEYQQRQVVRLSGNLPTGQGYESVFLRKNGTRFPVLIIEAPLINAQGSQTGWMSAILDMTDQRRMEEMSRASQERLQASARLATAGEMASLLSHELNQPLAAISSYATGSLNMLQTQASLSAHDVEHAMRRISEQAERAGKVIKSVHDFVRRRDQAHESVHPQDLLDAVMPLISLQARKLGVRVQAVCAPNVAKVQCDRTMVEQVLLNLARNAMQAMESVPLHERVLELNVCPTSRLSAQGDVPTVGRWIEFTVMDCGLGIDAATAERLFTPFFTTKAEGMGLGLSLCRTVVEQHGGFLAFEARKPRGTIFKFTLPTPP